MEKNINVYVRKYIFEGEKTKNILKETGLQYPVFLKKVKEELKKIYYSYPSEKKEQLKKLLKIYYIYRNTTSLKKQLNKFGLSFNAFKLMIPLIVGDINTNEKMDLFSEEVAKVIKNKKRNEGTYICDLCGSYSAIKWGRYQCKKGVMQRYFCKKCKKTFSKPI